jgi:bacillithiol biosynthesis deacetylase BshB1
MPSAIAPQSGTPSSTSINGGNSASLLLAFGAHPDDLELSCGGLLALTAQRGHAVVLVDLSRGECASNGTPELRAVEAEAAAKVLGATARENLDLPDGGLRAGDPEQLAALVQRIRRWCPGVVLGPWPDDRHPDHQATGALVEQAVFLAGLAKFRPDLGRSHRTARLLFYAGRHGMAPSFVVDVTAVYPQKQSAIACHRSQFGAALGGDAETGQAAIRDVSAPTLINAPLGLAAFEVRDRYWGAGAGVAFGEPFRVRGELLIADPVAHLAASPPPVLAPRS